jgi:hypothetical protein
VACVDKGITVRKQRRIQLFGEPTTAAPSQFFLRRNEKKGVLLSQIGFENCFLTMTAIPLLIVWIRPYHKTKDTF